MADETPENQETDEATEAAKAAAADAEKALEAIEAEAAAELPADDVEAAVPVAADATKATKAAKTTKAAADADDTGRANRRKVREGVVVSDAMTSTVVVAVIDRVRHPKYGKTVQRTKKLYVHDAEDTAKVGDRVRVQETRPISKLKRWRLTEVVERAR